MGRIRRHIRGIRGHYADPVVRDRPGQAGTGRTAAVAATNAVRWLQGPRWQGYRRTRNTIPMPHSIVYPGSNHPENQIDLDCTVKWEDHVEKLQNCYSGVGRGHGLRASDLGRRRNWNRRECSSYRSE
jgi:hypothetical protein